VISGKKMSNKNTQYLNFVKDLVKNLMIFIEIGGVDLVVLVPCRAEFAIPTSNSISVIIPTDIRIICNYPSLIKE